MALSGRPLRSGWPPVGALCQRGELNRLNKEGVEEGEEGDRGGDGEEV